MNHFVCHFLFSSASICYQVKYLDHLLNKRKGKLPILASWLNNKSSRFLHWQFSFVSSVLLFPPVTNYHRLLIHKTVEADFPFLHSFSVGEKDDRRTVVCWKDIVKQKVG